MAGPCLALRVSGRSHYYCTRPNNHGERQLPHYWAAVESPDTDGVTALRDPDNLRAQVDECFVNLVHAHTSFHAGENARAAQLLRRASAEALWAAVAIEASCEWAAAEGEMDGQRS